LTGEIGRIVCCGVFYRIVEVNTIKAPDLDMPLLKAR